ncbi:MAG: hypothetical protein SF162_17055 [bacterium]|nr:hypothetical protein [bacterium]
MNKRSPLAAALFALIFMLMMGCETFAPTTTPSPNGSSGTPNGVALAEENTPTLSTTGEPTHARQWIEFEIDGIPFGIFLPAGWIADYQDGLIMAERPSTFRTGEEYAGMLVYVFAPPLDSFTIPAELEEAHNMAWIVLDQAVHTPDMIGSATATAPVPFTWGAHDAAYYLLTTFDGVQTLVLGIALPEQRRLLVINVSAPPGYENTSETIRAMLPVLLDGMTVDGIPLHGADLSGLDDPFPFPPLPATQPTAEA